MDIKTDASIRVVKSDEEWRRRLTPEQYSVTRRHGAERAFTGPFKNEKRAGTYACVRCGVPLFSSSAKFESGTGWPSFFAPIGARGSRLAHAPHGDPCASCDVHLGHVFPDGPRPTGLRYCMNGTALTFAPRSGDP